jgi:uncharacterized membrane protein
MILSLLSRTPAAAESASEGFGAAAIVLIGTVAALVYTLIALIRGLESNPPRPRPGWTEWVTPVLAVAGMAIASYLAYGETQSATIVCGPIGNCNLVQSSSYAKLFGFLPTAVLGLIGYVAILLAWVLSRTHSAWLAKYAPLAILGMTVFGTIFSIYLTYVELFVILAVCMWCLSSAVLMSILMLLSLQPALKALTAEEPE